MGIMIEKKLADGSKKFYDLGKIQFAGKYADEMPRAELWGHLKALAIPGVRADQGSQEWLERLVDHYSKVADDEIREREEKRLASQGKFDALAAQIEGA
jgi:hypothetical protein